MIRHACYESPWGPVTIGYQDGAVVFLQLSKTEPSVQAPSALSDWAAMELQEYFNGTRRAFSFPMRPQGTDFQRAVWQQLCRIPYGQTQTYSQIAAAIGRPTAFRAVGMACKCNPIWIAIPCHRVVGKNTSLTGYAGGLDLKQALLDLENKYQ